MELQDPYGGGYWNTRDRWQQREATDADTAYKLALIAQGEREAQEAARLAPYEAQKRALELEGMQGKLGREKLSTAKEQNEYVRQRIGPIVAAHARGELPEIAARATIEQEIMRARSQFGIGDAEVQTLLQAGPKEWGMYLAQAQSVDKQMAPPPAPVALYQGDRVVQKRYNPRTFQEEVVGEGPRFNPKGGVNVTLNTKDQLSALNTMRDDREREIAPLRDIATKISLIRAYAAEPDALNSKQLQATLANLASTNVRAQAELNKYGNFGDLPTRFFGSISQMATGKYTKDQLEQALALADLLEQKVLLPSMQGVNDYYERLTEFAGVPSALVGSDVPGAPEEARGSAKPRKPLSAFGE